MAWNTEETVVQWGRQAEAADNMKNIKCKVQHPALKTAAERARTIEVKCKIASFYLLQIINN